MGKYIGHCGKRILWVSDTQLTSSQTKVLALPGEFSKVSQESLMKDYEVRQGKVVRVDAPLTVKNLKVAMVAVYGIPCGIATYTDFLVKELAPKVGDLKVFSEIADLPEDPKVVRCFKRGQPLGDLAKAIREYNPDVVYIQHEFGIFPNARYWLSFLSALHDFRVIVVQHSTFPFHHDKTICEAASPETIVHTTVAAKCLKEIKKIPANVHVIPHGCFANQNLKPPYDMYKSKKTVIQFGFGFRYKGWEKSLEAIALLKPNHPDVFFTGLFSESVYSKPEHDQYFFELQRLITKYGIEENVSLVRGYQSDYTLQCYLRTNRVAIFPYIENGEHTVYGASGAARLAMSLGIPTVVSPVPLFSGLEGTCPMPTTVDEIAQTVEHFFDPLVSKAQVEAQNQYLAANSWAVTAQRYLDILNPISED